jgi:hypothetical protein
MRRITIVCAVAAATLSAAPAALAGQRLLIEHEGGQPMNAGEGAQLVLGLDAVNAGSHCERIEQGTLTSNDKPSDKLAFGTVTGETCSSEAVMSGVTKEVKLSTNGTYLVKAAGKLVYRVPGPCVYDLSKMSGTFTPGDALEQSITGTGKLYEKSSSPSCPPAEKFEGESALIGFQSEEFLVAELRG